MEFYQSSFDHQSEDLENVGLFFDRTKATVGGHATPRKLARVRQFFFSPTKRCSDKAEVSYSKACNNRAGSGS